MNNTYKEHLSSLIDSVAQKLVVDGATAVLIKHYNSLDLTEEKVESVFSQKKIRYVYHEFDGSVMADAYEPFLSFIKKVFYKEYNMTIDEFLDKWNQQEFAEELEVTFYDKGYIEFEREIESRKMMSNIFLVSGLLHIFFGRTAADCDSRNWYWKCKWMAAHKTAF